MRWFSVFRGGTSNGWTPVTNSDNRHGSDMDELMCMASGEYAEEDRTQGMSYPSGAVVSDYTAEDLGTEPVFCRNGRETAEPPRESLMQGSSHADGMLCKVSCACSRPKLTFPRARWYLVLLSFFTAISFIALSVGLGYYSVIVKDDLKIDKSVKSFSIPNHQAYKNFEALMLARKNSSTRMRRDTSAASQLFRSKRDLFSVHESSFKPLAGHTSFVREKRDALDTSNLNLFGLEPPLASDSDHTVLSRLKRAANKVRCLFEFEPQIVARWKMHVIYLAHGDNDTNMFTKERLETVHQIEKQIIEHPGFRKFCYRDPNLVRHIPSVRDMNGCVPLNSLLTYFYPSKNSEGKIIYDGMGTNLADVDSALKLAMNYETFYYYVDDKINRTFQKSHLLRSEVLFGAPLPGYSCAGSRGKDQDGKFRDFVITYIGLLSKASTDKVQVLYGGNEIFDYEVTSTFWSDVRLAIISLIAIFVLMLVLSLSLYLTVIGIVIIGLSFPIAFFFYRIVFGINKLGILNGAAAFVIIGIGVDDVFVFINIYRQSSHLKDPVKRIIYTVTTAGVATFFTSFTTAAAFAANLTSAIPAVYDFGLFMSLIVSSCWVSVIVLMPPLLYLHACFIEPLEMLLFSCFSCQRGSSSAGGQHHQLAHYTEQQSGENSLYREDDVAMLDVNEADGAPMWEADDDILLMDDPYSVSDNVRAEPDGTEDVDVPLLNTSSSPAFSGADQQPDVSNNNMCLGRFFQKTLMFITNRIVIRGRYVIIGFYAAVLIASCVLMSQLQPSTHPPQLFRPDTNIQRLLDLKANLSIIDTLHCDQCSGLYKVHSSSPHHVSSSNVHVPPTPPKNRHVSPLPADSGRHSTPRPPPHGDGGSRGTVAPHEGTGQGQNVPHNSDSSHGENNKASDGDASSSGDQKSVLTSMLEDTLAKLSSMYGSGSSSSTSTDSSSSSSQASPQNTHDDDTGNSQEKNKLPDSGSSSDTYNGLPPPPTGRQENNKPSSNPRTHGAQSGWDLHNDDFRKETADHLYDLSKTKSTSTDENYNVCKEQRCGDLKDRPLMELGATVYVVFGVSHVNRSEEDEGHVLDQLKDTVVFDPNFSKKMSNESQFRKHLRELCTVCHVIANRTDLVKEGSAQCLPSGMYRLRHLLGTIKECQDLPNSLSIYQHQAPAHAEGGRDRNNHILWLAFAFESTTSEGQAYFQAYKEYMKWEELMRHIKTSVLAPDSPLHSMFQTSQFWTKVLMEVVAVNSAIYGLILSMLICVMAVAVFTGHLVLLAIVVVTIISMICTVVGIFYLAGWEMGAVEAVSLSILVGSSVDYCVHIVEGFILPGRRMSLPWMKSQSAKSLRIQRASLAVRHIGVAILCSALTTVVAAVPLTQTFIQPFAKFGSILLINTTVSMVMTLTLAVALMAAFGPAHYKGSWRSHATAAVVTVVVVGLSVLALYISTVLGAHIPGPSGSNLFSST